jgi:hypothetical protein
MSHRVSFHRASIATQNLVLFGGLRDGLSAASRSRLSVSLYGSRDRTGGTQHRDRLALHGDLDPSLADIAVILLSSSLRGWYSTEKSFH